MKMQPITITLADRDFTIRPTTIGQIERLEEIISAADRTSGVKFALAVIGVGLSRDYPDVAIDGDMEVSIDELAAGSQSILKLAGFINDGGAFQTFAQAGAAEAERAAGQTAPAA